MISSRARRNKSSWRSSRGWLMAAPDSEFAVEENHEPHKSGIPKRKKTATHNRLSCKMEYLLRSNHGDGSIDPNLTGDDANAEPKENPGRLLD